MNLFFVRHGETDSNKNSIYQGQENDTEINDDGIWQSIITGIYFKKYYPNIDKIYCSPLKRAKKTATIISDILGINNIYNDKRIIQLKKGKISSENSEIVENYKKDKNMFIDKIYFNRDDPIKIWKEYKNKTDDILFEKYQVEKHSDYIGTFEEFMKDITSKNDKNIIIVSHDGIIKKIISLILNIPDDLYFVFSKNDKKNCYISLIEYENGIYKMISPPNTYHLY